MQVIPQANGTLSIHDLAPDTVYDLGNARVYARCDAVGRVVRAHLAEGVPFQTIRQARWFVLDGQAVDEAESVAGAARHLAETYKGSDSEGSGKTPKQVWAADDAPDVHFDSAQAVGRTWIIQGQQAGLCVTVTTFLDRSSPAVFQRVQLTNQSAERRALGLDLVVSLQFEPGYAGAGATAAGRLHIHMNAESNFGATIPPWQLIMDKSQSVIRYVVPVAPGQSHEFCMITAAGDEAAMDDLLRRWPDALADAERYADELRTLAASAWNAAQNDPLMQSLIVAGINAALSAYKKLPSGAAGFLAGVSYAYPPRAYFRDGYWTAQAALIVQPELVRDHLLWLARGVAPDGSCPSGIWDPGLFSPAELKIPGVLNWITEHDDSPSFFVILLHDYVTASGDLALLDTRVSERSLWQHAAACVDYLTQRDQDGDGLFEKPHAANDWADNVQRDSLVTYDLALFYRALTCMAWLSKQRLDPSWAEHYAQHAEQVKQAINAHLWDESLGYYHAYQRDGFTETHLSIDTLLTVLYGITDEHQSRRSLAAAKRLLQTRYNTEQAYGDWGVMCCYPFYHEPADLFSISAEPYRYHNGADWPYWDGVYGLILFRRDDPDWRYVLTRWWEVSLERGLLTPVEYFSPPHPHGGLLQGWSAMPAVALLSKQYVHWLE